MTLTETEGNFLVKFARKCIADHVEGGDGRPENKETELLMMMEKCPGPLKDHKRGVFVTLHTRSGELRGCIGIPEPLYPIIEGVQRIAPSAAADPRFSPVTPDELKKDLKVEVSVLTEAKRITGTTPEELLDQIRPGEDGLILKLGFNNQGLFLPQVWDQLPTKDEFLANLCYKAGVSDPSAWKGPEAELYKFQVQIFSE